MWYAIAIIASFAAGFAYKAGTLDGALAWLKNQVVALYMKVTKAKEPKP
jgi:hypothetical protein